MKRQVIHSPLDAVPRRTKPLTSPLQSIFFEHACIRRHLLPHHTSHLLRAHLVTSLMGDQELEAMRQRVKVRKPCAKSKEKKKEVV